MPPFIDCGGCEGCAAQGPCIRNTTTLGIPKLPVPPALDSGQGTVKVLGCDIGVSTEVFQTRSFANELWTDDTANGTIVTLAALNFGLSCDTEVVLKGWTELRKTALNENPAINYTTVMETMISYDGAAYVTGNFTIGGTANPTFFDRHLGVEEDQYSILGEPVFLTAGFHTVRFGVSMFANRMEAGNSVRWLQTKLVVEDQRVSCK